MSNAGNEFRAQMEQYYSPLTANDGAISVDDLKKQLKDLFPHYTMTGSEPKNMDVTVGKHYLYIDDSQMRKMANDSAYRAKVYALMERESKGINGWTLKFSDGQNKSAHLTGSVFSLCEANQKYAGADGIPYHGSCTAEGDACFGSTQSHIQVRNQSFIQDHADPVKSAQKDRAVAKKTAKTGVNDLASKLAEKRKAAAKDAKVKGQKRLEQARAARKEADAKMRERLQEMSKARKAEAEERLEKLRAQPNAAKPGDKSRAPALGHLDALA